VLIELMILSLFYVYGFGIVKIRPSDAEGYNKEADATATAQPVTFVSFGCKLLALYDVFGTHWLSSDITTPLAGNEKASNAV
jgi:hypothetical protein